MDDFDYGIQSHCAETLARQWKAFPEPTPNRGTGLFTRTPHNVGDNIILVWEPLVAVLDTPRLEDTCSKCFGSRSANTLTEEKVSLKACTGCRTVKYCDKTCQSKDWSSAHKFECKIFKRLRPNILPSSSRAILRIMLLYKHGKITDEQYKVLLSLNNHYESSVKRGQGQRRTLDMALAANQLHSYLDLNVENEQLVLMFAVLDINCFTLLSASSDRIGLYMDTMAAYMNHSCKYNAVVGFDGTEMFVKAIRPIARGEEILISYIDATNPFRQRQNELFERYFFKCDCPKCQKGADARENLFLTPTEKIGVLEGAEKKALSLMKTATNGGSDPSESVQKLKTAIRLLHETSSWPITRQPYPTLRDELIVSLLEAQQFQTAFVQATIRFLRVDPILWPEKHHPTRHMHGWVLAKLAIHLSQGVATTHDSADLQVYQLNYGLLVSMLLGELVNKGGSCSAPSFQKMLEDKYDEVLQEFAANGINPSAMGEDIKIHWRKLEKIAEDGLKKDRDNV